MNIKDFDQYKKVTKVWGTEIWLTNTNDYCAKFLLISPGYKCSLHCHRIKKETFFVLEGQAKIKLIHPYNGSTEQLYNPGDYIELSPSTYHSFQSANYQPVLLLEVSTRHSDADVVRLVDSGPIEDLDMDSELKSWA